MKAGLVALNPTLGPPPEVLFGEKGGDQFTRERLMLNIRILAARAWLEGHGAAASILFRVAAMMRGGRAVDLNTELLLILEREGLL